MLPDEKDQLENNDDTQAQPAADTSDDSAQSDTQPDTGQPAKPDWKVEKYGPQWEQSPDYWKETASYWRQETEKEKRKRQQRQPLEDLDKPQPTTTSAKPNGAAKENGNGNGANAQSADDDIQTIKELMGHVDKRTDDLFEKRFNERLTEHQKESNFKSSMQKARTDLTGDADNGIPGFADLEQEVLIPLVEKNPKILALLREMDGDPGQNAYTLGMLVKFQGGFFDKLRGQGRDQLAKRIDDVSKEAVRVKSGKSGPTSKALSPEDIKNMSSADFEKLIAQNTGRG